MPHQEPLPGFDADPAEDEELRAVQFWQTAILSDLVLATLDALRSQAEKADLDTLRPPFSIELRLPAKTLSLDFPFESSAYEKYPEESLLRLLFTYDPSEAQADMDRLGPEYREHAARMREQVSAVTERIIREKAKEDPSLAATLTAEVRRGMEQAGVEAVNKLIAENIRKAESERLRGTSRTLILVSEGADEQAYPCTLEGFRESIRQLSYPPPVEYTHPAGMMLERMRKERSTSFELAFTATPDPNEPGPGITSGKLTIELVPLVLDVSRSLVNLDDFPTAEATPADMEHIESQLDALKDQDHWKGLLSICTAYFPVLATIETDPPNLHEITPEQRAAFWQSLLDAADRHFSDKLKQYAPQDQGGQTPRAKASSTRKRKLSAHKPTTTDGKRPYPVTASLLGASDPQLWLSFATPTHKTVEDTNVTALIGNLPVAQQRVFRAVQTHISRTNFNAPVLHFPNGFKDLADLCHVSTSGKEYQELTTAFMQLAYTPVHLYWDFNRNYFDFTGTLIQVTRGFEDLTPSQKKRLQESVTSGKPLPPGILQRKHEIIYQPAAILMQAGHYYRELPDTETQIKAVHGGKKRLAYLDPFLRLIDLQYFNRRPKAARKGVWTVGPISLENLCRTCGMGNMFTQRRPSRAFDTARKLAEIAVTMHRLKSFDFDNPDAAFMTLDHATLEQAYPERRTQTAPALPAPAASTKPDIKRKPKRRLTEDEEANARGLFTECAKLLRETLPTEFQSQGFTVRDASLSDEHVREVLRIIIAPYLFHAGGFEPQLSEVWLLGKEDKGGLRYLCKQIPARAAKAAEKDGRRKKSITRLSGYLLSEQKKSGRNLIEREMTALSDEIPEQTKRYRQKNLEGQGADALAKHAGMTRRVKALALSLGLDWPERD